MKSTNPSEWAYYIISYSPSPENNESANVGLLVSSEKRSYITYDENFPRLQSIGTNEDGSFLRFTFDSLLKKNISGQELLEKIKQREPQFIISQPHELLETPDSALLKMLKKHYLSKPEEGKTTKKKRDNLTGKLDLLLLGKYNLSKRSLLKNVDLKEFVSQKLYDSLPKQVHKISRCYDAQDKLLFIDTISLHSSIDAIMNRFVKLNKVFWQYGKHKDDIYSHTGKKSERIGIIFNGIERPSVDLLETHDFIKEKWEAESVIDSDKHDDLISLSRRLNTAINS